MERKRTLVHIEAMRICAVFFVIYNHTAERGYFLFAQYGKENVEYWIYLVISIISKFSVPLFLMISGALLLNRKTEAIEEIWKHRILKMTVTLMLFSLLSYMQLVYQERTDANLVGFIKGLYSSGWNFSYWYLYMYLAFLITLPFLRNIASSLSREQAWYMIGLAAVFNGVIPLIQFFLAKGTLKINNMLIPQWMLNNIVLYPCIGFFLENFKLSKNEKRILFWITTGLLLLSCVATYLYTSSTGKYIEGEADMFFYCPVLFIASIVYSASKDFFARIAIPRRIEGVIIAVGKNAFGIYLVHIWVMMYNDYYLYEVLDSFNKAWKISPMISVMIYCIGIMILSYNIVYALKKLPVFKRLLN